MAFVPIASSIFNCQVSVAVSMQWPPRQLTPMPMSNLSEVFHAKSCVCPVDFTAHGRNRKHCWGHC